MEEGWTDHTIVRQRRPLWTGLRFRPLIFLYRASPLYMRRMTSCDIRKLMEIERLKTLVTHDTTPTN